MSGMQIRKAAKRMYPSHPCVWEIKFTNAHLTYNSEHSIFRPRYTRLFHLFACYNASSAAEFRRKFDSNFYSIYAWQYSLDEFARRWPAIADNYARYGRYYSQVEIDKHNDGEYFDLTVE